ncbi:MAG: hypothetical protein JO060_07770 [Candidatus Eremiobacteraeota bacterium]|nr:hypothetical protein [Candidatus Eremiobacteraeota bacterium]
MVSPRLAHGPSTRRLGLLCAALTSVSLFGCAHAFQPGGRLVPAPAGALAAAPLSRERIAVLAGSAVAKGIFIVDEASGVVLGSFGVTREATGVTAATPNGPLLLSIGANNGGSRSGAVEVWGLGGVKRRVVPLPTEGIGITAVSHNTAYVLLGGGDARAAAPISISSLRVGKPVPLSAGATSLQLCPSIRGDFLLYSAAPQGLLILRSPRGDEARSRFAATGATCANGGSVAYAIAGGPLGRSVSTLSIPALQQLSSAPASNDAVALYETMQNHLLALNSTPAAATLEVFRDETVAIVP